MLYSIYGRQNMSYKERIQYNIMNTFSIKHSYSVKGVAILLLLFYHLFASKYEVLAMGVNYEPFPLETFRILANFGHICVAIFVFMTAFGISRGLFEQQELTPYKAYSQATKRFLKLMADYLFLFLSVNILWGRKFDYASIYGIGKQGLLNFILDATGIHSFYETPTINVTWWYMKIAYILIFLVPLLAIIAKSIGYPILIISLMIPLIIPLPYEMEKYLFTATLGVCAAYGKWPEKLMNIRVPMILQWLFGILGFVFCVLLHQNEFVQENYLFFANGIIALFFMYFGGILMSCIPGVSKLLQFVGKHSMNIYCVHTFFYLLLWRQFIYQFRYAGVILLVLLVCSLFYSVVLEFIKKYLLVFFKSMKSVWEKLTRKIRINKKDNA